MLSLLVWPKVIVLSGFYCSRILILQHCDGGLIVDKNTTTIKMPLLSIVFQGRYLAFHFYIFLNSIAKPENNNHPWNPKLVAVVFVVAQR